MEQQGLDAPHDETVEALNDDRCNFSRTVVTEAGH